MSDLSDLAGSPSTLIPGFVLSRLDLEGIGAVEDTIQRFYIQRAARATVDLSASQQVAVTAKAAVDAAYYYVWDTPAFAMKMGSAEGIMVTLLESIRQTNNQASQENIINAIRSISPELQKKAARWCWWKDQPLGEESGPSANQSTGQQMAAGHAGSESSATS